jgi:hypothetical protein
MLGARTTVVVGEMSVLSHGNQRVFIKGNRGMSKNVFTYK